MVLTKNQTRLAFVGLYLLVGIFLAIFQYGFFLVPTPPESWMTRQYLIMIGTTIFFWPWVFVPIIFITLGALHSSFTLAFILLSCAVFYIGFVFARVLGNTDRTYLRRFFLFFFSLANIGLWFTLPLSQKEIAWDGNPQNPFASGGFPFTAFYYPFAPMGNNIPPLWMWPKFYLNYLLWMAFSLLLTLLLPKRWLFLRKFFRLTITFGIILFLFGIGYLLLKFD